MVQNLMMKLGSYISRVYLSCSAHSKNLFVSWTLSSERNTIIFVPLSQQAPTPTHAGEPDDPRMLQEVDFLPQTISMGPYSVSDVVFINRCGHTSDPDAPSDLHAYSVGFLVEKLHF